METSSAEALLKGTIIPVHNSAVVSIKKVDNNTRQVLLENGKTVHISKDRIKAFVSAALAAKARKEFKPGISPGHQFAAHYAARRNA